MALSFIICLVVLFAGYYSYNIFVLNNSLIDEIKAVPAVAEVELNQQEKIIKVLLSNQQDYELPLVFNKIQSAIQSSSYTLEFTDNPSKKLEQFNQRAQFTIQTAMASGNYEEMLFSLENLAHNYGIVGNFYIDEYNIYFRAEEKTNFIIAVVPRNNMRDVSKDD